MRHAEKESLLKSFLVFFISLSLLVSIVTFLIYSQQKEDKNDDILTQMKLCSFDLKCDQFAFDFVSKEGQYYELLKGEEGYYSLFPLPEKSDYALKLTLSMPEYEKIVVDVQKNVALYFTIALGGVGVLSFLFSLYALYPLKEALRLTQEFSRDMLHDLHTPIAALKLNLERLSGLPEDQKKINRMKQSVETIISLGENLKSYLEGHPLQATQLDVCELVLQRVEVIRKLYPLISFHHDHFKSVIDVNKDAFSRVIDNVLTNAAKYNHPQGEVFIDFNPQESLLTISDTGKGIKHPQHAFKRFYKEHERGLGIGLHIVKKLCDEMKIGVRLESQLGTGTRVTFDLSQKVKI